MKRSLFFLLLLCAAFISACREKPASDNPVRVTEAKEEPSKRESEAFLKSIEKEGRIIALFYDEDSQLASFAIIQFPSSGSCASANFTRFAASGQSFLPQPLIFSVQDFQTGIY